MESQDWDTTYPDKAATHVGVGHGKVGLGDGFFKDQVYHPFQPLLRVDVQLHHLFHQLLKLLGGQLVEDAADPFEELEGLE